MRTGARNALETWPLSGDRKAPLALPLGRPAAIVRKCRPSALGNTTRFAAGSHTSWRPEPLSMHAADSGRNAERWIAASASAASARSLRSVRAESLRSSSSPRMAGLTSSSDRPVIVWRTPPEISSTSPLTPACSARSWWFRCERARSFVWNTAIAPSSSAPTSPRIASARIAGIPSGRIQLRSAGSTRARQQKRQVGVLVASGARLGRTRGALDACKKAPTAVRCARSLVQGLATGGRCCCCVVPRRAAV